MLRALRLAGVVTLNLLQDGAAMTSEITSEAAAGPHLVIWGTDVVVSHCKEKFRRFVETFVDKEMAEDERVTGMDIEQPLYLQRLEEVSALSNCNSNQYFFTMKSIYVSPCL